MWYCLHHQGVAQQVRWCAGGRLLLLRWLLSEPFALIAEHSSWYESTLAGLSNSWSLVMAI